MTLKDFERMLLWRLRLGFEQREWAEGYDIGQSMLSQIEWGKRGMTDTLLKRFLAMEQNRVTSEFRDADGLLAPTEGEQIRIRCRRLEMNMAQSAVFFGISDQKMLELYRTIKDVPTFLNVKLQEKE